MRKLYLYIAMEAKAAKTCSRAQFWCTMDREGTATEGCKHKLNVSLPVLQLPFERIGSRCIHLIGDHARSLAPTCQRLFSAREYITCLQAMLMEHGGFLRMSR